MIRPTSAARSLQHGLDRRVQATAGTDRKVEMRGRAAFHQLTERLTKDSISRTWLALLRFDFTPIANPGGLIAASAESEPAEMLSRFWADLVQRFAATHARHWRKWGQAGRGRCVQSGRAFRPVPTPQHRRTLPSSS